MRKRAYPILIIMLLCIYSISLTSCEAITAQNITSIDLDDGMNDNSKVMKKGTPDVMGKIISVSASSIKIELIEENQNDKNLNSNEKKENIEKDINDSRSKVQIGRSDDSFEKNSTGVEKNSTGVEKTLAVSDDVQISEESTINPQSRISNSKSSIKLIDLKKGQVVMIWYKEDTEIVEKISVM